MNNKNEKQEPMEAILVRIVKNKNKLDEKATKLKTVTRIKAPSGPALINGQWW